MRKTLRFSLVLGALVAAPVVARAQSVTLSNPVINRYHPDGSQASLRGTNFHPNDISYQDCLDDLYLVYTITQVGITTSNQVQVWVGTQDCSPSTARQSGTQACWKVVAGAIPIVAGASDVKIPVRNIVSLDKTPKDVVTPTADVCSNGTSTGPTPYTIYFLPIQGDQVAGTGASTQINVDLLGPPAPTNVSAGTGDTLLVARWTPQNDPDTQQFIVYCDPPRGYEDTLPRGSTSTADAGVTTTTKTICPDAGSDASDDAQADAQVDDAGCYTINTSQTGTTGGSGGTCDSKVLVNTGGTTTTTDDAGNTTSSGKPANIDPKYECARVTGASLTSANITGLRNDTVYAVAVAATDSYGNAGPLSSVGCGTPQVVDDFWKQYRQSGGQAGGTFCALEGAGMPAGTVAAWISALAAAAAFVRRRRSGR